MVEVPAFDVPATGVVDYRYPRLPNPLGRDVWGSAVEIIPGDRAVVHHVLAGLRDSQGPQTERVAQIAAFCGYAPGKNTFWYPDDTGVLLRKDASLLLQVHYTPNGKAHTETVETTYVLKQSKVLPAGTRVVFDMTWDNSAQDPANPDPDRTVHWGDQTWDEMNADWIRFRYLDDSMEKARTAQAQ